MTNSATYQELLTEVHEFWHPLPDKPEETPHSILKALWHTASGFPLSAERAQQISLPPLDGNMYRKLRTFLDRKKDGVPLAHLTERQHFLGMELLAGLHALIPRKETEILGRAMVAKLKQLAAERGHVYVMDLCTGSGNLALAYANHVPAARVIGSDICANAIALAKRNALHLKLHDRVEFLQGDMFSPFETGEYNRWDLVSCNPPYVTSAKVSKMHLEISRFEPEVAFDGGHFGISVVSKLLSNAPRFLKHSSWLGFEVGLGQGNFYLKQLKKNPVFCAVEPHTDETGNIRALLALSNPS